MGAKIHIQSGIASGTVHWIQRSVTRIGSDPAMDLTIPCEGLAKHALTLEYREGTYRVHNRSSSPVYLGGRTVQPGASETWMDADLLELTDSVRLAMDWDNDPAPSPVTKPVDLGGAAAEPGPASASAERLSAPVAVDNRSAPLGRARSSQTWTQIAVIVACVVAGVLLLVRDQSAGNDEQENLPTFAQIVNQSRLQSDDQLDALLQRLQYAEAAMIRGNSSAARERFRVVRSELMSQSAKAAEDIKDPVATEYQDMIRWVEYRLSQL